MSITVMGYDFTMPPHRDWTRHGVGRALLWWPFLAFVAVAAFPTLAAPLVLAVGAVLVIVGLVGGAVGRRVRERRRERDRRAVTPFAPRAVREALPAPREPRDRVQAAAADADSEGDKRPDLVRRVA